MGLRLASDAIARARTVLDDGGDRWSDAELLGWLSDGQRTFVGLAPQANSQLRSLVLQAEDAMQHLPVDTHRLIKLGRNLGPNGTTHGRLITQQTDMQLQNIDVNWTVSTPEPIVKHFTYDPATPFVFMVYPRPRDVTQVEGWISVVPDDIPDVDAALDIQDAYFQALIDYALCRAYQKNSDVQGATTLIAGYDQSWRAQVAAVK